MSESSTSRSGSSCSSLPSDLDDEEDGEEEEDYSVHDFDRLPSVMARQSLRMPEGYPTPQLRRNYNPFPQYMGQYPFPMAYQNSNMRPTNHHMRKSMHQQQNRRPTGIRQMAPQQQISAPIPVAPPIVVVPAVPVEAPPLTFAQTLANMDPQEQKNSLGEALYPMIYNRHPTLAGKITGMLLEMENTEILELLESPEALNLKVDEAIQVLRSHGITN